MSASFISLLYTVTLVLWPWPIFKVTGKWKNKEGYTFQSWMVTELGGGGVLILSLFAVMICFSVQLCAVYWRVHMLLQWRSWLPSMCCCKGLATAAHCWTPMPVATRRSLPLTTIPPVSSHPPLFRFVEFWWWLHSVLIWFCEMLFVIAVVFYITLIDIKCRLKLFHPVSWPSRWSVRYNVSWQFIFKIKVKSKGFIF